MVWPGKKSVEEPELNLWASLFSLLEYNLFKNDLKGHNSWVSTTCAWETAIRGRAKGLIFHSVNEQKRIFPLYLPTAALVTQSLPA